MIEHLVFMKLKEDTSNEKIEALIRALKSLVSLPGVVDITAGRNFTDRGKGFNFALRVTLTDRAALEKYGPCPEHQRVKEEHIIPILEDILAIDYEY
jgi:hypothetical protein